MRKAIIALTLMAGVACAGTPAEYFGASLVLYSGADGMQQEDQTLATAYDASAAGNDGTMAGDAFYDDSEGAFTFDGTGGAIQIVDDDSLEGDTLSVSVWVYHDSLSSDNEILVKGQHTGGNPLIFWEDEAATDHYAFYVTDSEADSSGVLYSAHVAQQETWTHLAVTFVGGKEIRMYINGVEDGASPLATPNVDNMADTAADWFVGDDVNSTKSFAGDIAQVMIFNRALTADEIQMLYNGGVELGSADVLPKEFRP